MNKEKLRRSAVNISLMTVGSLIYAAGIGLFLDPNNLAPGGVSGIAIILHEVVATMPTGTWIVLMNIPIMLLGVWKFGLRFLISSIYCVALSSLAINILNQYSAALTDDPFLACVAGGVLVSAGIGLVFRGGSTTGGTDIIVKLLKLRFRYLNTGNVFLFVDGIVVVASGIVFRDLNTALYAAFAVFVQMIVLNMVLYGTDNARMVYIISKDRNIIAERIMKELDAGATFLHATGAYTGNEKEVLMCVLRMRSLPSARDIVRSVDPSAFMIVTSATSVFGEGFKSHEEEEL